MENALVLWMTKPHGSKFARASGQLRAKPPVFCKHAARTITGIWIKNEEEITKNLIIYATHVLNKWYLSTLCMADPIS